MVAPLVPLIGAGAGFLGRKALGGAGKFAASKLGKNVLAGSAAVGLANAVSGGKDSDAAQMGASQENVLSKLSMPGFGSPEEGKEALTGSMSNMAVGGAGMMAGWKEGGLSGAMKGGLAGYFGKLAFNNIQKDGGRFNAALFAGISGACTAMIKEGGPSPVQAFVGNAGFAMATDSLHDNLECNGQGLIADVVAGGALGGMVDYAADGELSKKSLLLGAGAGGAYGALLNGELSDKGQAGAQGGNAFDKALQSGSQQAQAQPHGVAQSVAALQSGQAAQPVDKDAELQA